MNWLSRLARGFHWLVSHKKTFFIVVLIFLVLAIAAIINVKQAHNRDKLKTPNTSKSADSSGLPDTSQIVAIVLNDAKASIANKDYDNAARDCDAAAARYYYLKDYSKAKSTLVDCMSLIPRDKAPWFLYKSLGYIEVALNDKTEAKKSFSTALEKYKTVTDQLQSDIDELKGMINQAGQ